MHRSESLDGFVAVAKALSDPHRVRALVALRQGELCVCQIIELLGLAPSTVSKHMSVLRQAGLVVSRKEERWMYYRLPEKALRSDLIRKAIEWVMGSLEDTNEANRDTSELAKITRQSPSRLCRLQRCR